MPCHVMPCTQQFDLLPHTTSVALAVFDSLSQLHMVMQGGNKCAAAEAKLAELSAKVEATEQRAADAEVRSATMAEEKFKLQADLFSKENALAGVRHTYADFDMQLLNHTCSEMFPDVFQVRLAVCSSSGTSVAAQVRRWSATLVCAPRELANHTTVIRGAGAQSEMESMRAQLSKAQAAFAAQSTALKASNEQAAQRLQVVLDEHAAEKQALECALAAARSTAAAKAAHIAEAQQQLQARLEEVQSTQRQHEALQAAFEDRIADTMLQVNARDSGAKMQASKQVTAETTEVHH